MTAPQPTTPRGAGARTGGALRRVHRALARTSAARPRRAGRDEGAALVSAILMMLVLAGLSVLVLALVVGQVVPTQLAQKNQRTVFAAEAGVQATLNVLRTASQTPDYAGRVFGNLSALPCTVSGAVADAAGDVRYDVTVKYYLENPSGKDAAWLTANAIPCSSGPAQQPVYALVTAGGTSAAVPGRAADDGDRGVQMVYRFNVTNVNVAGGLVYAFGRSACLQADGTTSGSEISYVAASTCGSDDETQLWVYDDDYMIKLASSMLPGKTPLCITGPANTSSTLERALLRPCKDRTDTARWNQLWSWEGGARWRGETSAIDDYSVWVLDSGTRSGNPVGRKLHVDRFSSKTDGPSNAAWGSFDPDPRVGPGAASISTRQIVNYLEFGRCFDVTDETTSKEFMIVYPCKQDPSIAGNKLKWNHKWYYSEPDPGMTSKANQEIFVYDSGGTKFCLESPASGQYPVLRSCNTANARQKWTRHQNTGNYSTSYTFTDNLGRCISIGDKYSSAWSKIVVTTCNGESEQKWNAPPESVSALLGDYREVYN